MSNKLQTIEFPPIIGSRHVVYVHVNRINNKKYVGITNQNPPSLRWGTQGKRYGKNSNRTKSKFWYAIQKYGWNSFDHIIIMENLTIEEAKVFERYYIDIFNSKDNGYNMTNGGDGSKGCHPSEETRKKIAFTSRRENLSLETRKKLSESHKRENLSEETIEKLREAHRRRPDLARGWHHTQESIDKMKKAKYCKRKPIICLNNLQRFTSVIDVAPILGINKKAITNCCRGKAKTSGTHPITGEKLNWIYVDSYEKLSDEAKEHLYNQYYTGCENIKEE